jgi:hypothetical protein
MNGVETGLLLSESVRLILITPHENHEGSNFKSDIVDDLSRI